MRQQASLQQRNGELAKEIAELRDDVAYLQSDSYVEQAARTVLLWGRPGEKLIISRDNPLPAAPTPTPPPATIDTSSLCRLWQPVPLVYCKPGVCFLSP